MKICVLPGDGIGPEIIAEAVRVLQALELGCEMEEGLLGGCAVDATGEPYPQATQALAQQADAVLLGAVGGPQWDNLPRAQRPERGLLGIRQQLGLFANLRPADPLSGTGQRFVTQGRGGGRSGHPDRP
jgi:3-isopropylmalate dehydrogenase